MSAGASAVRAGEVALRPRRGCGANLALLLATFTALFLAACGGEETPVSTPPATAEPRTSTPPATAELRTPTPEPATVTGLFADRRPTKADVSRSLSPPPASSFQLWDGASTVIYDTLTGEETNLGEGSLGAFSPDSTRMVWVANPRAPFEDGEAWLIDLSTMEKRSLGPGHLAAFVDNDRVGISLPGNNSQIMDLRSGARQELKGIPFPQPSDTVTTDDGYELRKEQSSDYPFLRSSFFLTDPNTGRALLEFEAYQALPAGPGSLAVATSPVLSGPVDMHGLQGGTLNIFIVDINSGRAQFVATSRYSPPNWPLAANANYVMWTEDYCGQPPGSTWLYDRRDSRLTETNGSLWATFTPGGLIASGAFGATVLIDPATLEYKAVIPGQAPDAEGRGSAGDVSWSPDYRYASHGLAWGHGGLCG
jgi:hypothetical protein